jgi:6-pyruvoyltetrahydropterin/6-carboxytetrahydropterin synthase
MPLIKFTYPVEITREFTFDSCHKLIDYVGKCANLHGHTYHLQISLKRRINPETGMVIDFGDLNRIVNELILDKIDHVYLNDVMDINPTAENMVCWIWKQLEKEPIGELLNKIKLWETPNSFVTITADDILEG